MPLAKLNDLKARIGLDATDAAHDELLGTLLTNVSGWVEQFCGRHFIYTEDVVETFDGDGWDLRVKRFPVVNVTSVIEDGDHEFEGVEPLTKNADYVVRYDRGVLTRQPQGTRWLAGDQVIRVTYSGGYTDPGEAAVPGVEVVPPHVQEACLLQAVDLWNRKGEPGVKVAFSAGASVSAASVPELRLLAAVKELLANERR